MLSKYYVYLYDDITFIYIPDSIDTLHDCVVTLCDYEGQDKGFCGNDNYNMSRDPIIK